MTRSLNWGLLSTAHINEKLMPAIRGADGHRLYGVASRDAERAQDYASEWGIPHAYGSYEALLADEHIDVVYNALPNHLHAAWTIKAAEAGKHVLCEKPIALNPQEVDAIAAAAAKNQVVVMEAFMYRHHPRTKKVRELVNSGALGKIEHFSGHYTFVLDRPGNYRWLPEAGGGSVWDVGCYPVSYARLVMGRSPVEVLAKAEWIAPGADFSMNGILTYGDGATAEVFSSFGLPVSMRADAYGREGALLNLSPYHPGAQFPLWLAQEGQLRKLSTPYPSLYRGEVLNMGAAIRGEASPLISLAESREINAVICALIESAQLGKAVRLE
jgi:predicted dehydrogenase